MKEVNKKLFRRVSVVLMLVAVMCTLIACGKENSTNAPVKETDTSQETVADKTDAPQGTDNSENKENAEPDSKSDAKILIAYFSWSGNSKSEAELIQEKTGGTLFEIVREEAYPEDYTECTEVAKKEKEENARPVVKNPPEDVSEYDKIVVCYPIWWHTAPMCVGTFLEKYDLQGKTVYPVSQSASMDEDQFAESVQFVKDCAKGANVEEGLFVDADDDEAVTKYVEETILQ